MSSAPFEEGFDSGYNSTDSSAPAPKETFFTRPYLKFLNSQLQNLEPQDILKWCITSLPQLYQETAFGLTGLVAMDMLAHLSGPIPSAVELIFVDTLHNFDETIRLLERVQEKYPQVKVNVYKPTGARTADEFAALHKERLWESDEEQYDYLAKVEPTERAYRELDVQAVLTGRRKTQGGKRANLDVIEIDDNGLIKVNPFVNWTYDQICDYIHEHDVPYNELLDQGYKSIGDWHSTQPVAAGEDERAGRWKGRAKTECGIHNPKSRYAMFLAEQERQQNMEKLQASMQEHIIA